MADNNDLLHKIGNLIDQKLEAEREHTRKLVREEVEVEGNETRGEFSTKLLEVQVSLIDVKGKLKDVAIANTQTNTSLEQNKTLLEAVAAGQKDIREKMATKDDIHRLEQKIDKVDKHVKSHESRIDNLEDETGLPNPHKN